MGGAGRIDGVRSIDMDDPTKVLKFGSHHGKKMHIELIKFLCANLDVFAWTHSDMCGLSPEIACHTLKVDPKFTPVKQKRHNIGLERSKVLREEVDKLMANGFILDATYPEWVSNPVLVKKSNGKW